MVKPTESVPPPPKVPTYSYEVIATEGEVERLETLELATGRSDSFLIGQALMEYLDKHEDTIQTFVAFRAEHQGVDLPVHDGGFPLDVKNCARCKKDHHGLIFCPLQHPIEREVDPETHWAPCPTNGQPILMRINSET